MGLRALPVPHRESNRWLPDPKNMFIRRPFIPLSHPVVGGLVVAVVVIDIRSTGNWGLQVVVIRYYKLLGVATSSIYSYTNPYNYRVIEL